MKKLIGIVAVMVVVFAGCKKQNNSIDLTGINNPYTVYIDGTIQGNLDGVEFLDTGGKTYGPSQADINNIGGPISSYTLGSVGANWLNNNNALLTSFNIVKKFPYEKFNQDSVYTEIVPSKLKYAPRIPADSEGAIISIRDSSGTLWYSDLGDNGGSVFTITYRDSIYRYCCSGAHTFITGKFTCYVYKQNLEKKLLIGNFKTKITTYL